MDGVPPKFKEFAKRETNEAVVKLEVATSGSECSPLLGRKRSCGDRSMGDGSKIYSISQLFFLYRSNALWKSSANGVNASSHNLQFHATTSNAEKKSPARSACERG